MNSYDTYSKFYDAVEGSQAKKAAFIKKLIKKNQTKWHSMLDVACGTGNILCGVTV